MRRKLSFLLVLVNFLILLSLSAYGQSRIDGWCEKGNESVTFPGMGGSSTTKTQRSYPGCTITVTNVSGGALSTIFSDSSSTPKANPFTADASGYWFFYANNGNYTVVESGGGLTSPVTLRGDIKIVDAAASPLSGSGTTNKVVKWTNSTVLGDSILTDTGSNIGVNQASPNAAALLDLTSTSRGFLPPRMTTAQRDAISSPLGGLIIYNTTTNAANLYTTSWGPLGGGFDPEIHVESYNAKVDGKLVGDASMSSGSAVLTSGGAGFTSADVGKLAAVDGAGVAGATLLGTIITFTDSSHVTLSVTASTNASPTNCYFGTDDTTALTNAIAAANSAGQIIRIPSGKMILTGGGFNIGNGGVAISTINAIIIKGSGGGRTQISFQGGATEIWWMGNSGVPIFTFLGPISGAGVEGIFFDCKVGPNAASSAIRPVWAHKGRYWDISVTGHSGYALDFDTIAAPVAGANLGGDDNIIGELWLGPPSTTTGGGFRLGGNDTGKAASSRNQIFGMSAYSGTDATSAGIVMRFGDSNTFYGVTTFAQGSGKGLIVAATPSNPLYPAAISFYNSALQGGVSVSGAWTPASKVSFFPYSNADGETTPTDAGFNGVTTGTTLPSSAPPTWFGAFTIRDLFTFSTNPLVSNTAPGIVFTDTTAAAKGLTVAVDANHADLRESGGVSGSLVNFDLSTTPPRMCVGCSNPAVPLQVNGSGELQFRVQGDGSGSRLDLYDTAGSGRNWTIRSETVSFGDIALSQSAAAGGDAFSGGSRRLYISPNGSIVLGTPLALATNGTEGFLYIPSSAGIPTGSPSVAGAFANTVPVEYDTTNSLLMTFNSGGWLMVGPRFARTTASFDKTSDTTLANITNLTHNVAAGKTYKFRAILYTTSNAAGGVKFAIAGTATATSVIYEATVDSGGALNVITASRATALATAVGQVTAVTVARCLIEGTIVVNAAGTLTVQFAQNASTGTASSVLANSTFEIEQVLN